MGIDSVKRRERFDVALLRSTFRGKRAIQDLADALEIKSAVLSRLLSGMRPGHETWPKIAELLGVDLKWLEFGDPESAPGWHRNSKVQEPAVAYGTANAQTPKLGNPKLWPKTKTPLPDTARPDFSHENPEQVALVGTVSAGDGAISYIERPRAFRRRNRPVMRVVGNSAYPVAYDGQYVEVDLDNEPRHNNLVVVETAEPDETGMLRARSYLKRYCIDARAPDGYVLASVNAGIDTPYIPHNQIIKICRVVGVIFEE